ncbi:MAG: HDIG domain-containing protein [Oscillatoriales cyanobacterium SM2_1_8]|nr:HDIG domain-containing protein [Oscillatoriales cyanobacterium SM2_1_8]
MGTSPTLKKLLFCPPREWFGRLVLGGTFVCLVVVVGGRFFWEPRLRVGVPVPFDVRAPQDAEAIDRAKTAQQREEARNQAPPVFTVEPAAIARSQEALAGLLPGLERLRAKAGAFPYANPSLLSLASQQFLRGCPEEVWQALQGQAVGRPRQAWSASSPLAARAGAELAALYQQNPTAYRSLAAALPQVRLRYRRAIAALSQELEAPPREVFDLTEAEWQLDRQVVPLVLADIVQGGVVAGLPAASLGERVDAHRLVPLALPRRQVLRYMIQHAVSPSLRLDWGATERRRLQAAEGVAVTVSVRAGEVLVRSGQTLTQAQFDLLDALGLTQRQPNWPGIALAAGAVGLAMAGFARGARNLCQTGDVMAVGLTVTAVAIASVGIRLQIGLALVPLAVCGTVLGSFYGRRTAWLGTGLLTVLMAIALEWTWIGYVPLAAGAWLAAIACDRPSSRTQLAVIGLAVAVVQAGGFVLLTLLFGGLPMPELLALAWQYALGGVLSSSVALAVLPYLEHVAYAITPIRLAELANLDRPLLRRLATEAPGTFQHTLFVANLAEAAARELGADTALVRTGTLYHDIGKTLQPEYFIENQMGQPNPHDALADPWRSAQIIKEHVTGGLRLAQRHGLPELLQTFIPEHQGTIVISYFWHKAQQLDPAAQIEDFRYDGPAPQSRETGIVMLADACEAALRSLGAEVTMEEARETLWRIFQARWQDGQLNDAGLNVADLERIAQVFIRVWQERNHGRIKYPPLSQKLDPTGSALPNPLPRSPSSLSL